MVNDWRTMVPGGGSAGWKFLRTILKRAETQYIKDSGKEIIVETNLEDLKQAGLFTIDNNSTDQIQEAPLLLLKTAVKMQDESDQFFERINIFQSIRVDKDTNITQYKFNNTASECLFGEYEEEVVKKHPDALISLSLE